MASRSYNLRDQVGALEVVDHGEAPVGSANLDLSELAGTVSVEVVLDIEHPAGNAQLDENPDRHLAEDLLAHHDYYYCC